MVEVGVSSLFWLCSSVLLSLSAAAEYDRELPACSQHSQHSKVLTFFMHDDLEVKPVGSAFIVVPPLATINGGLNRNGFGSLAIFDDAITEKADVNSKLLARGRGFYMFNAIDENSATLEIQFTVVFGNRTAYPGSTLSYQGYDKIADPEREISIVGGTGVFRLARGWAVITTEAIDEGAANLKIKSYVYYGCDAQTNSARSMNVLAFLGSSLFVATLSFELLFQAVS